MTEEEAQRIFESMPFKFARTMPGIPHYYTLRNQWPEDLFCEMVQIIRDHGHQMTWGKYHHLYLYLGEWRYWTMWNWLPEAPPKEAAREGITV